MFRENRWRERLEEAGLADEENRRATLLLQRPVADLPTKKRRAVEAIIICGAAINLRGGGAII